MSAADASLLNFSESIADFGTWLVIVGVAGEGIEIVLKILRHKWETGCFANWHDRHEFSIEILGAIFWLMVVAGLAIEFAGNHQSKIILDRQNAELYRQGKYAEERAETATLLAAQANERTAKAESANLTLQAKVLELEAKSRWRTIKPEQENAFIELTKNTFKLPIRVRMGDGSSAEVQSFATRIRAVLDKAGFVETNKEQSIAEWPPELNVLWTGMGPELSPIIFVSNPALPGKVIDLRDAQIKLKTYANYATNTFVKTEFEFIGDDSTPQAFVRDENGSPVLHIKVTDRAVVQIPAFGAIQNAFNAIGIPAQTMTSTNIPVGAFEIFVNPK